MNAGLPAVLFVCVENSCRSQMAEAFAHMHGAGRVNALSTGSEPCGTVNPRAVQFMAERGYDLSTHESRPLEKLPALSFDAVISMGCGDRCPAVPARIREDWDLPDPKHLPADEFREIRDDIERRVVSLLDRLTADDRP